MMTDDLSQEELAHLRVMFALKRLSPKMQTDVLSDMVIVELAKLDLTYPIGMPDGLTFNREDLFSGFEQAAAGTPITKLKDHKGVEHDRQITIEGADGFVISDTQRVRFPNAVLLAKTAERRRAIANLCLATHTLTQTRRKAFEALIAKPDFQVHDFFAASNILAGAPENFADRLRTRAQSGSLAQSDLIPDDPAHWENLTAEHIGSTTLEQFISSELAAERAARFVHNADSGLDIISVTFASPELVPIDLLQTLESKILDDAVARAVERADPMALVGLFAACARRSESEPALVSSATAALQRVFADVDRLRAELSTYAAAFVIATRYLVEHEVLREKPVFWRRLAAAAHASLVTRCLGEATRDDTLVTWAMRLAGKSFYLSVLLDAHAAPRWRPDWISPENVIADLYGRAREVIERLGDAAPLEWKRTVEKTELWVQSECTPLAYAFPALMQGAVQVAKIETPDSDTPVGEVYRALKETPSVEALLRLQTVAYVFGIHPDVREAILAVMQLIRTGTDGSSSDYVRRALDMAAFVAALNKDAELADVASAIALERYAGDANSDQLMPTVATLVEASAALADRSEARALLARRLENLTFISDQSQLLGVLDTLSVLRSIDGELSPLLGRAIATAKLGIP